MNKITSFSKALTLPVLMLLVMIIIDSCSKSSTPITPPPDPPPPPPASASISWTVDPTDTKRKDTSFYLENRNVSIVLLNATSGGIDGVTGTSTTTGLMTNPKTFTAWAKNSAGAMVTSSKTIPLYTQNKTNLVGNGQGLVKWVPDTSRGYSSRGYIVADTLIYPAPNATELNAPNDPLSYRFNTDNTGTAYGGVAGPGTFQYSLFAGFPTNEKDSWIVFPRFKKIEQLTASTLILVWWQRDANNPNIMYMGKSWYTGIP